MRLINFLSLFLIVIVVACQDKLQKDNALTEAEKSEGWQLLFDGQTTNGWRFFKGDAIANGWKVADGILYNSGIGSDHGGDIVSMEKFKDFELSLEWKIDSGSNSGIFYHVEELDSIRAIYESGPEYQLLEEVYGKNVNTKETQLSGANYGMNAPVGAVVKPLGQWNKSRIVVKGSHVEHWLNDVKVVEYEFWTNEWIENKNNSKWKDYPYYGASQEGYIGLQDHGGLTGFKNIKIRRL
jgi:hypothetical protein